MAQAGGAPNMDPAHCTAAQGCRSASDDSAPPEDAGRTSIAAAAAIAAAAEALSAARGDIGLPPGLSGTQGSAALGVPQQQPGEEQLRVPSQQPQPQGPLQPRSTSSGGDPNALAALGLGQAGSLGLQSRLSWDDFDVGLLLAAAAAHVSSSGGAPASAIGASAGTAPCMSRPSLRGAPLYDASSGTAGPPGLTPAGSLGGAFALQPGSSITAVLGSASPNTGSGFGSLALSSSNTSGKLLAGVLTPEGALSAAAAAVVGASGFFNAPMGGAGATPPGLPLQLGAAAGLGPSVSRFAPAADALLRFPAGTIRTARPLSSGMAGLVAAPGSRTGTPRCVLPAGAEAAGGATAPSGGSGLGAVGMCDESPGTAGSGGCESGGSTPVKKTRRGCRGGRQKRWYMAQQMAAAAAMSGAGVSSYDVYRALSSGVPVGAVLPSLAASGLLTTAGPAATAPAAAAVATASVSGVPQHLLPVGAHISSPALAAPSPLAAPSMPQLPMGCAGLAHASLLAQLPRQRLNGQL